MSAPLDPHDPRFGEGEWRDDGEARRLVASRGPGYSPQLRSARILRVAVPALAVAGVLVVVFVFVSGLDSGSSAHVVGPAAQVRAAVAERPWRVCLRGAVPCAWLTLAGGEVLALNTSGPIAAEYGRQGVGWCPTSGYFGANSTGSRYDPAGRLVRGPAPRSLDRFTVSERDGMLVVHFTSLTAGLAAWQVGEPLPPRGPDCETIPFERAPDLVLQ